MTNYQKSGRGLEEYSKLIGREHIDNLLYCIEMLSCCTIESVQNCFNFVPETFYTKVQTYSIFHNSFCYTKIHIKGVLIHMQG